MKYALPISYRTTKEITITNTEMTSISRTELRKWIANNYLIIKIKF